MSQRPLSPPRLLVVDDDNDLRGVLQDFLTDEGYVVDSAASLDEALALIDTRLYHLIITDLLAHSTTTPLSSALAILDQARPTPVVALTGWDLSAEEVEGTGLLRLIRKPFDLGELQQTLEGCLAATQSAEQQRQEAVARQFFEQLTTGDVASALALCVDDLRMYPSGASGARRAPAAEPARGRAASRTYLLGRAPSYPEVRLDEYVAFPQPKGLAMRYLLSWQAPDEPVSRRQMSGAIAFEFRDARISQVTLNDRERFTAAIARPVPTIADEQDCQD
ncbi:MAG: response regulator [Ktedonobacterales bacterium]